MSFKQCAGAALVGVLVSASATPASASTTYKVVKGYKITSNPAGPWSYMTQGNLLTVATTDPQGQPQFDGLWDWSSGGTCDVQIDRNSTKNTINFATAVIKPSYLRLDPQCAPDATVRFQAPTAGNYVISGKFLGIDTNQVSHQVAINENGVSIFSGTISTYSQAKKFNTTVTLAAGDVIDFVVMTGGYTYLSTGLEATIVGP